ncbi:MAG: hypothetical protein U0871_23465 [Gemmataceae bacterium]
MVRPFALLLLLAAPAVADDRADAVAAQRKAADAVLAEAKLKVAPTETDDLLVYSTLPPARAKPLAAALQKAHTAAVKASKRPGSDPLWAGKLTVYVLPDARAYKAFVQQGLKESPAARETYRVDVKADPPAVAVGAGIGEKPTDAQLTAEAAAVVGAAVLDKAHGVTLPDWLRVGFGRAVYLRADGPKSQRLAAHRAKVRALYARTGGAAFSPWAVWGGKPVDEFDTLAASFAEFLAFGPLADGLPKFVGGFKPSEQNENPTPEQALEAAGWKPEALDAAWKQWVLTGK